LTTSSTSPKGPNATLTNGGGGWVTLGGGGGGGAAVTWIVALPGVATASGLLTLALTVADPGALAVAVIVDVTLLLAPTGPRR
jgi:hypothetical protein